jgi:hypothetical protein
MICEYGELSEKTLDIRGRSRAFSGHSTLHLLVKMRDVLLEMGVSIEGPRYLTLSWGLQWK